MQSTTLNDIGTDLEVTVQDNDAAIDVSSATAIKIVIKSPSGVESEKTASNVSDGTDGKIHYLTVSGDIDETGIWQFRARVTFSASSDFYTNDWESWNVVN